MAALSGVAAKRRVGFVPSTPVLSRHLRGLLLTGTISLFATMLVTVYLMPLGYAAVLSVRGASIEAGQPIWPSDPAQFSYGGGDFDMYNVALNCSVRRPALTKPE